MKNDFSIRIYKLGIIFEAARIMGIIVPIKKDLWMHQFFQTPIIVEKKELLPWITILLKFQSKISFEAAIVKSFSLIL